MSRPERSKDRHYSFSDVDEGSVLAFGGSRKRFSQQLATSNKKDDPKQHYDEVTGSKVSHDSAEKQKENAKAKHEDSGVGSPSEDLDITGKGDMTQKQKQKEKTKKSKKKDGPKFESIEEEIEGQCN
jgi:hypothetical protein